MTTFSGMHSFGESVSEHPLQALRRTGTVTDLTGVPAYVTVAIGGDDPTNAQPMPYIDSYKPDVDDVVLILTVAGDNIVLGRLNSLTPNHLNGFITAHAQPPVTVPDQVWTELSYDTVDNGGNAAEGQLSLNSGKLLIPRSGVWVILASNYFPTGPSYLRSISAIDAAGNAAGPNNATRNEVFQTTTNTTGHYVTSAAWPIYWNAGQLVTGYAYQNSASSAALGAQIITGYQVG